MLYIRSNVRSLVGQSGIEVIRSVSQLVIWSVGRSVGRSISQSVSQRSINVVGFTSNVQLTLSIKGAQHHPFFSAVELKRL